MMNIPAEVAQSVVDSMKSTPFVMALVLINVVSLLGFGFILYEVAQAQERREWLIKACIERRP